MKPNPSVVQLSRFKAPTIRKGRPYTVDFGIAKPLYKQLLSYLANCTRTYSWNRLQSNKIRLIPGLVALYVAVLLPFTSTSSTIVYADPITPHAKIEPIALLIMPAVASIEPVSALPLPITQPSALNTFANLYSPGQCTYGVASRISIPNDWGNANTWANVAAAEGYTVSGIPKVGAIAQTTGDSYAGHVALVEAVNPDGSFVIWEMNGTYGPFTTDERTTTTLEFPNFIYL